MCEKNINVNKYFLLLESLKFPENDSAEEKTQNLERLEQNLSHLKRFIKIPFDCTDSKYQDGGCSKFDHKKCVAEANDVESAYSSYLEHALLLIVENINFNSDCKEDLISTQHMNLIIKAVNDVSYYALRRQLHAAFYKNNIFNTEMATASICPTKMYFNINFFDKILNIKQFHVANSMELVIRDYMAYIFSTYLRIPSMESSKEIQAKLDAIWLSMSKLEYFKNLMLFKSLPQLPNSLQKKLHQEMLQKLASKDGFTTLVAVLQLANEKRSSENGNEKVFEVIANIAAHKGHSRRFQAAIMKEIFSFLRLCLRQEAMMESMGAGLLTLRRLHDLNSENCEIVGDFVKTIFKKLINPEDVLSGLIVMEHSELCGLIAMIYQLFYTSTVECLPSELLIDYLPLLLELYYNLPDALVIKQQVADVVARCLNNRDIVDLNEIIRKLYTCNFDSNWKKLHERIVIFPNATQSEVCIKISKADYKSEFSISLALPELLLQANHPILLYNIFMALLELMEKILLAPHDSELDLDFLQNEEELIAILNSKYSVKIEIIFSLNTLISYPPLKSQISENNRSFLKSLRKLIEQRIDARSPLTNAEAADQTLLIMLTLTQELLEQTQLPEEHRDLVPILKRLGEKSPNLLVQQKVKALITLLSGDMKANASQKDTPFSMARSLLESHESHLQVYGIQILLDLLRKRDEVAMGNAHVIVALALTTLKQKESYTFLNCVRLFVALINVMESEVLDILSDEYLNENASMDFRLVVGEAILKVSQELGPLCYKYKDVLVNMFMYGARSPVDEFRMSSFANLAQLCRTLSYQVLKFFQELLNLIDCELSTGKYLPSKRAALLVLSELLEGIDNLKDFEEILLPVYRLLKLVATNEFCDEQMRVHATNGLKALSAKCHQFLFPEEILRKEIRIFGIKDEANQKKSAKHILEIN